MFLTALLQRFYVWPPASVADKPIVFVPESQFRRLHQEIQDKLPECEHEIPETLVEHGFVVQFPDHPALRPRFLGRSSTRDEYNEMQNKIPHKSKDTLSVDVGPPDDRSLAAFKRTIEAAIEATKAKSKHAKAKKKEDRVQRQQVMTRQLKRTERYLGLRPRREKGEWRHRRTQKYKS